MAAEADWVEEIRRWLQTAAKPAGQHKSSLSPVGGSTTDPSPIANQQQDEISLPANASRPERPPS